MGKYRYLAALCVLLPFLAGARPVRAAVFSPDVRVHISIGKPQAVSFTPVGAFTLQEAPGLAIGNEELSVSAVGGRVSIAIGGKSITAPSLTFLSGNYGKRTDYIRLRNSEHGTCTYLGNMTFDVFEGAVRAINTLPVEQYLYGVVPHEMSNLFPVDALKAQAVCARGYAVARSGKNLSRAYDILDTSQDQVYRGYASRNTRAIAAVDATSGQVLTYNGDIIETYYSASNGGQTEKTGNVWSNDFPYYVHADDPFDTANASSIEEKSFIPEKYTEHTEKLMDSHVLLALRRGANKAAGREVTLLATVLVTPKSPSYSPPSRCYTEADVALLVGYEEGGQQKTGQVTITLKLEDLKFGSFENTLGRIGAGKTRLRMRGAERGLYYDGGEAHPGWYITERRYGHGVGMSQRGAQQRARMGQLYKEILSFYYVDTVLYTVGTYETAPQIQSVPYKVRQWGISGLSPGTTAEELLQNLSSEGKLSVVNGKGSSTTGNVCTGYFVRITYQNGKAFFDLPIVLYGDTNGDGAIGGEDVSALQSHLLRATLLTGPRLGAADVDHDGEVTSQDMLLLIRYIHGDAKLSQGGA